MVVIFGYGFWKLGMRLPHSKVLVRTVYEITGGVLEVKEIYRERMADSNPPDSGLDEQ